MRQRDRAICLAVADFSETSQVVHFLSRAGGVVRLLAKGAKRAKSSSGGAIDLLSEGELVYIPSGGESLGTLVEFAETADRRELRRSVAALNAALYMIELTRRMLADGDPHEEVFDLLRNSLGRVGQAGAPVRAVLAYFQWRLLRCVGLLGEMKACVGCGRAALGGGRREVYFCSQLGGLLCGGCEAAAQEKYRLDGAALAGLAALAAAQAGRKVALPDKQADAVNRLLAYHVAQQTGKPLRMARYVMGPAGRGR